MSKHVLFVAYGGGHITMIILVAKAMQQKGWKTTILGLTTASLELNRHSLVYLGFKDFIEASDHYALEKGKELAAQMHTASTIQSTAST